MILKDLMEENQLNLNQPLLSVRRFSSTLASETDHKSKTDNPLARLPLPPAYKSELNSVPKRNAGNVPFVWEKAPGRPRDESKFQTQAIERSPLTSPNFPPGRASQIKQQSLAEMRSGSTLSNSQSVASLDKKVTKHSKGKTKERGSSVSDDGDEAYEDARDLLSRTESFFMSCSVSGLSGWDEQEVQPFGSFSSDHQQGRDFMIDRFLLAAKAMTSEAPQYASKKASIGQEHQKHKKNEVNTESSCPINQHWPKALPHYTQDIKREESGDERDDYCEYENYTTTTCGLFPRFSLLNPMPGLRMVDKVQRHAAHGMQAKSDASHIASSKEQGRTHYGTNLIGGDFDSVHKVKSQTNDIGGEFETFRRDSGMYNNPSTDSSPKVIGFKKMNSESQVYSRDKNSSILTQNSELDLKRQLAANWVDEECTVASSKERYNGKIDLESQCLTKLGHQEISGARCFELPIVLPSLKAPSESWLKRTLPTICNKNMTSQSNLTETICARSKTPKTTSSLRPKWETMVKSSNACHGQLQLPEDL